MARDERAAYAGEPAVTGVVINGRFLTRSPTGVDRFATELLRAWLPRHGPVATVKALVPSQSTIRDVGGLDLAITKVGKLGGHAWEQLELSGHCGDDMLLSLCNTGPITRRRQLAVLHDAGVMARPRTYSFAFRNWYRWLFAGLMKHAGIVATVSKFSAGELMSHVGPRAANVELIFGAGEHVLRAPADTRILERLGLVDCSYVLAVGSLTPNKNFNGVLRAAALLGDLDCKIVAAGGANTRVFNGVNLASDALIMAGYVTDGELRALYESAACFIFPSFYEGFGLPPLEAMHCGCPVIVSDRASLPEVCGDAAVYCDPDDPADMARQLRLVLTSSALRRELREAGLAHARSFGWQRSADQLDELLALDTLRMAA
jgi:glycosyltransferase involved in cell wall biosynthesis